MASASVYGSLLVARHRRLHRGRPIFALAVELGCILFGAVPQLSTCTRGGGFLEYQLVGNALQNLLFS